MLHIKLRKIAVSLDFTFFAVIALFLCFDKTGFGILSVLACLIHESGHLIAMVLTSRKIKSVNFRGGGIKIVPENDYNSVIVILAGSAVNIALFFALYLALPKTNIYPVMFAILNLVIGFFNLLPIGCLDGKLLMERFAPYPLTRALEIIALLAVIAGVIVAFLFSEINFTLIVALIYILAVDIFAKV